MAKVLKRSTPPTGPLGLDGLCGPAAHLQARIEREAEAEGLAPLTPEHWAVIQVVLDDYLATGQVPVAVRIGRSVGLTARQLSKLFPSGAAKTACRLAGLELPPDLPTPSPPRTLN